MEITQILILAIVQGLTEFLPISSSAHLILVPLVLKWPDQGLVFDVAIHLGSLLAVLFYFRKDLLAMFFAWCVSLKSGKASADSRLAWWIILATIPAVIVGLVFKDVIEAELRSPWVIAIATIVFGLLLWLADSIKSRHYSEHQISWKGALTIGCFQALALIPGTSRSGITMTAGLLIGMSRRAAARFSFLLSIPIIIASAGLQTLDLIGLEESIDWVALGLAVVLSAISAGTCIHFFLSLIEKVGMLPFVVYRLVLGAALIFLLV